MRAHATIRALEKPMRRGLWLVLALSLPLAWSGAQDRSLTSLKQIPDKPRPYKSKMHPSPADWRDQSIYFLFPDRFCDGDPSNNRAGHTYFDLKRENGCHGGDFRGIIQKLDYIKNLGATAIWVTPVLQNWTGYHGYATCNFLEIEPHLGGLDDFRAMVDACHKHGIYVIVDIVVNHEADLIYYKDGSTAFNESGHDMGWYKVDKNDKVLPIPTEFQDLRLFHNYGNIDKWDDLDDPLSHAINGDFSQLDDFKTELPEVRDAMCKIYKFLIAQTDIDGFRVDTVKHVDKAFWQTWCPAIHDYARSIGKKNFFIYGEGWMGEDERVAPYTGTKAGGKFLFDGMLNFPMFYTLGRVFSEGQRNSEITERVVEKGKLYQDDALMVNFIDNHDMPRFLHGRGEDGRARLKNVLGFIYTTRGIPCLYYGTEQGFDGDHSGEENNREDMWDNREWPANHPGDHFDQTHELYKWVQMLNKARKELEPLRRGDFVCRHSERGGSGLYAFTRATAKDEVLVIINTSGESKSGRIPLDAGLGGCTLADVTGSKEMLAAGNTGVDVTLPGYGVRIFRRK